MNKTELISQIAYSTDLPKTKVASVVDELIEQVAQNLVKGDPVSLLGFGTFQARKKSSRKGRNPRTGEEITIPARVAPEFKASSVLKNRVNGK